jgi:hypothetical protein
MSLQTSTKIKNFLTIIAFIFLTITIFTASFYNLNTKILIPKSADAAGPNSADLIIGRVDNGSTIELSVCIKATSGPLHLTNVTTWWTFDNSALTTTSPTLVKGAYGNGTNGYSSQTWKQVLPAPVLPNQIEKWGMSLAYNGDPLVPGLDGIQMQSTAPELFGKAIFTKVANATAAQTIIPVSTVLFTTESQTVPLVLNVINTNTTCTSAQCPNNTISTNGYNVPNPCTANCIAGNYYIAAGSTCNQCPAGSFCTGTINPPSQCLANTYCPAGATSPTNCPPNTSSIGGSTSLIACIPTCLAGTYYVLVGSTCNPCPAGSSCTGTANPPVQCPANTYCTGGNTTPTNCNGGYLSPAGSVSLAACIAQNVVLNLKAFLSGAFNSTTRLMSDMLALRSVLPTGQPYNAAPYSYTGTESLPTSNRATDISDWVLLEVKNPTTDAVLVRKAAIAKTDGTIIEASNAFVGNTNNSVSFAGLTSSGNYKITLRHRNHFGISTNTPINLTLGSSTTLDFSSGVNIKGNTANSVNSTQVGVAGGGVYNPIANAGAIGSYIYGIKKADANSDGATDAIDRSLVITSDEYDGIYSNKDLNLDAVIDAADRNASQTTPEAVETL